MPNVIAVITAQAKKKNVKPKKKYASLAKRLGIVTRISSRKFASTLVAGVFHQVSLCFVKKPPLEYPLGA